MPAEIVVMEDCASNYGVFYVPSSSGMGRVHTVTFSGSEGPAHCTCESYKYSRDRDCKHIRKVWEQACLYNPQWHNGQPDPELRPIEYTYDAIVPGSTCPACGGPTVAVRRAV